MKQSFPYIPPATDSQLVYTDGETMDEAVEAFESQDYVNAIHLLIDALDGDFRERYGNEDGTSFRIPHGSIVVQIDITKESLHISAEFLRLPEKGRVAMLRQIAEMNINNLMLARFVKSGDYLRMDYKCPLTDTHPHKIHAIIYNICAIGDKYDDEFCTRFKAERCYTPKITPYTQEEVDKVYDGLQTVAGLALKAAGEYNSQRRYVYAWTIIRAAIHQFTFIANPQGQLINEIEKAVESMSDERPIEELVSRGTAFLQKLMETPKEELAKDLYTVEMMVSMKPLAPLQSVQDDFESLHEDVTQAMQKGDYDQVVVRIFFSFYSLLAENNISLLLEYLIITALRESAGLPLKEAAGILLNALDKIMDGDIEPDDDDEDEDDDDEDDEDDEDDDDDEYDDDEDEDEDEDDDDEDLSEMPANILSDSQKLTEAMSGEEIADIQRRMDDALKAGNMTEYMRLATELQMRILSTLGS